MHADLVFLLFTITLKFASHNEISQNSTNALFIFYKLAIEQLESPLDSLYHDTELLVMDGLLTLV